MLAELQRCFFYSLYIFLHISSGGSFPPPLSSEEERACFERIAKSDKDARDRLIVHNLRLVAHIVKKYYGNSTNQDDIMSIGTVGLIKAVDTFRIDSGARFATYAAKCIQNEILMYFRSQKKLSSEVSINETIDIDKDGNPLTYIDIISCDDTIAEDIFIKLSGERAIQAIKKKLSPRERRIITLRYGLGEAEPMPQREIAEMLGISRSYVSRIEKSALEKLREYL